MPFFTVFGALSDKIGRKKIMMAGCLIAVIAYIPIYHAMERAAGSPEERMKDETEATRYPVAVAPLILVRPTAELR